jgi:hypothetical protein
MVDFKKLMEEDAKKTPEQKKREFEESVERHLKEQTLQFEEWTKQYDLKIDFEKYTLTITTKIKNWEEFYSEAKDYGFRYVGGSRLVRAFNDDDNFISRLYNLKKEVV